VQVAKRARRDHLAELRENYQNNPEPLFLTYGPKTRREFLNLLRWSGGSRI
jgi:uncharacterized protein